MDNISTFSKATSTKNYLVQEGTTGILSSEKLLVMKLVKDEDVGNSSSSSKKSFSSDMGVEKFMSWE